MKLPKELTDSILQGVVEKVMDELTPGDDTPDDDEGILGAVKRGLAPDQDKDTGVMNVMLNALSGSKGGGLMDVLGDLLRGGQSEPEPQPAPQQQSSGGLGDILGGLFGGGQKEPEPHQAPQQQSSGGLGDILGGLFGGGQKEPEPQQAPPQQQSSGGLADLLGGLFGGGQKEPESQPAPPQQQSSGGLADLLGGLFGGGQKEPEPQPQQSSGGGLMDILGGLLGGGGDSQRATKAKDSGLLGTITDAIGGEGLVGDLLESVLRSKNITASNLAQNPSLMDKVKNIVVDLIKDFVIDKVKASLLGNSSQGGSLNLNKILDMLTPDN